LGIYAGDDNQDMPDNKIKGEDYSFLLGSVHPNVEIYLETLINNLNANFDKLNIHGNIEYFDRATQKKQRYESIRRFFNIPENTRTLNPSPIGKVRIEPQYIKNQKCPSKYDLEFYQESNIVEDITSRQHLLSLIKKRATHRIFIVPTKLYSFHRYYGAEYKMVWKVKGIEELYSDGDYIIKEIRSRVGQVESVGEA
jgi:hypothetical protein